MKTQSTNGLSNKWSMASGLTACFIVVMLYFFIDDKKPLLKEAFQNKTNSLSIPLMRTGSGVR